MRYVRKTKPPKFFKTDTRHLKSWGRYKSNKKRDLKRHILRNEQFFLCIYCEGKVDLKNSHIEHLKPKDYHKYPEKVFTYENLAVSCNGDCQDYCEDNQPHTCGHIKANLYDENRFLDPTKLEDIEDYFVYDAEDGRMLPSEKAPDKAMYMIFTILQLNAPQLCYARLIALKNLQTKIAQYPKEKRRAAMKSVLNNKNIAFISFLRYRYRSIIND